MLQLSPFVVTVPFQDAKGLEAKHIVYSTWTKRVLIFKENDWKEVLHRVKVGHVLPNDTEKLLTKNRILCRDRIEELNTLIEENEDINLFNDTIYQVIMPSASCQLGCNMKCYGAYCGQRHSNEKLEKKDDKYILSYLEKKLRNQSFKHILIGWFGGEPLLGFDCIRRLSPCLMDLAKKYNCTYRAKMVTNGLLLSKNIWEELRVKYKVSEYEITLDGGASAHNTRRCLKNGMPTFDKIVGNLSSILSEVPNSNSRIRIRCNVDRRNVGDVKPLLKLLHNRGFHRHVEFYVAPVHPWGNEVNSFTMSSEEFAAFEIDVFREMLDLGFRVHLLPRRKPITCLATNRHATAISPSGNLHKCTETPMVERYKIDISEKKSILNGCSLFRNRYALGKIDGEVYPNSEGLKLRGFVSKIMSGKLPCAFCSLLPVCGGACPLSWAEGSKPCPSFQENIKERLVLWVKEKNRKDLKGLDLGKIQGSNGLDASAP
jgi:uncharacterized protein